MLIDYLGKLSGDEDKIKTHFTVIVSACVGWVALVKNRTEW
jgi:hypothetical protein